MLTSIFIAGFGLMIAVCPSAKGEEKQPTPSEKPAATADSKKETEVAKPSVANPSAANPSTKSTSKTDLQKKPEVKKNHAETDIHDHKKEKRRGHAHVHGATRLNVVASGKTLTISGDFPLMDLTGFERSPQTAEEKTALSNIFQVFRKGSVVEPVAKGCTMTKMEANVEPPFPPAAKADKSPKEAHYGIDFELSWQCEEEMSKLRFGVFEVYPRVNQIDIQFVNQNKQGNIDLKRADKKTEIELK